MVMHVTVLVLYQLPYVVCIFDRQSVYSDNYSELLVLISNCSCHGVEV